MTGVQTCALPISSTDDGTAVGAALEISARLKELENKKINNWFLGLNYSNEEIGKELKKEKLSYKKLQDIEKETASLLKKNKIIAWFQKDRKSTRLNSSHTDISRMPSSA